MFEIFLKLFFSKNELSRKNFLMFLNKSAGMDFFAAASNGRFFVGQLSFKIISVLKSKTTES